MGAADRRRYGARTAPAFFQPWSAPASHHDPPRRKRPVSAPVSRLSNHLGIDSALGLYSSLAVPARYSVGRRFPQRASFHPHGSSEFRARDNRPGASPRLGRTPARSTRGSGPARLSAAPTPEELLRSWCAHSAAGKHAGWPVRPPSPTFAAGGGESCEMVVRVQQLRCVFPGNRAKTRRDRCSFLVWYARLFSTGRYQDGTGRKKSKNLS